MLPSAFLLVFSLLQTHALELRALWGFCLIDPDNDGKAEDTFDVLWMLRGGPEVALQHALARRTKQ